MTTDYSEIICKEHVIECLCPSNIHMLKSTQCGGAGSWSLWEVISLDKVIVPSWWGECPYKKQKRHQSFLFLPGEDRGGRWKSTRQE